MSAVYIMYISSQKIWFKNVSTVGKLPLVRLPTWKLTGLCGKSENKSVGLGGG